MPRRPRIQLDGVPLHIVQRGHNREPCFFGEEDYASYLHCDPAHSRWTSYRHNALGTADSRITSHALYLALGASGKTRQAARSARAGTAQAGGRTQIRSLPGQGTLEL